MSSFGSTRFQDAKNIWSIFESPKAVVVAQLAEPWAYALTPVATHISIYDHNLRLYSHTDSNFAYITTLES